MPAIALLVKEILSWQIKVVTTPRNIEYQRNLMTSFFILINCNDFTFCWLHNRYTEFRPVYSGHRWGKVSATDRCPLYRGFFKVVLNELGGVFLDQT